MKEHKMEKTRTDDPGISPLDLGPEEKRAERRRNAAPHHPDDTGISPFEFDLEDLQGPLVDPGDVEI
jgi:hypothetical protein